MTNNNSVTTCQQRCVKHLTINSFFFDYDLKIMLHLVSASALVIRLTLKIQNKIKIKAHKY